MPHFDWTITTGNLAEMAGTLGGGLLFLYRVCARLDKIEAKMAERLRAVGILEGKVDRIIDHLMR